MANGTPNQYRLHNRLVKIEYLANGIAGRPHVQYDDGMQVREFDGDEVRVSESELGTLVSVTLRITVDQGSTAYTFVIPAVKLANSTGQTKFRTFGVKTEHKTPLVQPASGQREVYSVERLNGIAEAVQTLGAQAG